MTDTQNPFRDIWNEGDTITYLDLDMVVTVITDGWTDNTGKKYPPSMTAEYLNTRNEIQRKVFYLYHIPALKLFNR